MIEPMNPPRFSRPRTMSQEYVRMRKLVQNGITSSRMNRPLWRLARVAMKYASGRPTSRQPAVPARAIQSEVKNGSMRCVSPRSRV
jgi:hypothetical protein